MQLLSGRAGIQTQAYWTPKSVVFLSSYGPRSMLGAGIQRCRTQGPVGQELTLCRRRERRESRHHLGGKGFARISSGVTKHKGRNVLKCAFLKGGGASVVCSAVSHTQHKFWHTLVFSKVLINV